MGVCFSTSIKCKIISLSIIWFTYASTNWALWLYCNVTMFFLYTLVHSYFGTSNISIDITDCLPIISMIEIFLWPSWLSKQLQSKIIEFMINAWSSALNQVLYIIIQKKNSSDDLHETSIPGNGIYKFNCQDAHLSR